MDERQTPPVWLMMLPLVGLGVLLITRVLTWEDVLNEKGAWNTFIWLSALVMMASQLNALGFVPWFGQTVAQKVSGLEWTTAFLILALVYFYSHYMFASQTAHISAMYAPFLGVALAMVTLAHRLIISPSARIKNIDPRAVIQEILDSTPVTGARYDSGHLA